MNNVIGNQNNKTKWWFLGAQSIFNIAPIRSPRIQKMLSRSDAESIYNDWKAVGDDLRTALESLEKDNEQKTSS